MKKIMMMLAVATSVFCVQAASFSWTVSNVYAPTSSDLSPNKNTGSLIASGAATVALLFSTDGATWTEITSVAFDKAGGIAKATAFTSDDLPDGMTLGVNYFKAVVDYTADGKSYTVELFEGANTAATSKDLSNLANSATAITFQGITSATTGRTWAAVPEPTSGLLMLVGLAGLALRRRRA